MKCDQHNVELVVVNELGDEHCPWCVTAERDELIMRLEAIERAYERASWPTVRNESEHWNEDDP